MSYGIVDFFEATVEGTNPLDNTTSPITVTLSVALPSSFTDAAGNVVTVAFPMILVIDPTGTAEKCLAGGPGTSVELTRNTPVNHIGNPLIICAPVSENINQLATSITGFAPINSPSLTGIPLTPTPLSGAPSTQIATVGMVTGAISSGGYAPLANPTFTGVPQAPTASGGTDTTQLATTEFVQNSLVSVVADSDVQAGTQNFAADSGSGANIYVVTLTPTVVSLTTGMRVYFIPGHTNGSGASTLDVGTGAIDIKVGSSTPVVGAIVAGEPTEALYDGTYWQLINRGISGLTVGGTSISGSVISAAYSGAFLVDENGVVEEFPQIQWAKAPDPDGEFSITVASPGTTSEAYIGTASHDDAAYAFLQTQDSAVTGTTFGLSNAYLNTLETGGGPLGIGTTDSNEMVLATDGTPAVTIDTSQKTQIANADTAYNTVVVDSAGKLTNVAPGTAGEVLTSNGATTLPSYQAAAGAVAIGAAVGSSTDYNILSVDGSGDLSEITPSTAGHVLTSNGTSAAATFQAPTGADPLTTKGDLFGYDTGPNRVPKGTDGKFLMADSSAALGVSYQTVASGSVAVGSAVTGATSYEVFLADASGNLAQIPIGTATEVLTSNGAGALPTFQAPSGGGGSTSLGQPTGLRVISNASTPNTKVDISCRAIVCTTGSANKEFTAVSCTVDIGASGVNGLDTGSIAANTLYFIHVIGESGGTVNGLLSSSAPTMPGSYTYFRPIGWAVTDGSSHFLSFRIDGNMLTYDDQDLSRVYNAALAGNTPVTVSVNSFNTYPVLSTALCREVLLSTQGNYSLNTVFWAADSPSPSSPPIEGYSYNTASSSNLYTFCGVSSSGQIKIEDFNPSPGTLIVRVARCQIEWY